MSLVKGIFCFGGLAAALVPGLTQPAHAQEAPPPAESQAAIEDGELIYARDVSHSIGTPYFPGASHTANTAPTRAIIDTLATGLAPITDVEAATLTGTLSVKPEDFVQSGLAPLMRDQNTPGTQNIVSEQSAAISSGSAIGSAMGALTGALGSLSVITGGQP